MWIPLLAILIPAAVCATICEGMGGSGSGGGGGQSQWERDHEEHRKWLQREENRKHDEWDPRHAGPYPYTKRAV